MQINRSHFYNYKKNLRVFLPCGLKTYNNTKVRAGQKISNPRQHAVGYAKHVETTIQKQVDKAKSVKR